MSEEKLNLKVKGTWVSMYIDAEANNLLTKAAKRSRRTKRSECEVRLKDHLQRFSLISTEGVATSSEKNNAEISHGTVCPIEEL